MKEIAIFIPCYNEEKRLKVLPFQDFIKNHEHLIDFYFVDDGSIDKTTNILQENFSKFANTYFIRLSENLGKGNALRAGIFHLQEKKDQYQYLGFIDADLDIPLEQILKLYDVLEANDSCMAISSRELYSKLRINLRSVGSVIMVETANRIIKMNPRIKDTQCGCKLFKKEIIEICFNQKFKSEWLFDIELFLRLKKNIENARQSICEVPLKNLQRSSNSNFRFLQNLKIFKQLYLINTHYN